MIGGTVVETILVPAQVENDPECLRFGHERAPRVWINVRESEGTRESAIFVALTNEARSVSPGDTVWWQGGSAYWTPKSKAFRERELRRIGGSGVARPVSGPSSPDAGARA